MDDQSSSITFNLGATMVATADEGKSTFTIKERGNAMPEMLRAMVRTLEAHKAEAADLAVMGMALMTCSARVLNVTMPMPVIMEALLEKGRRFGTAMGDEMLRSAPIQGPEKGRMQ